MTFDTQLMTEMAQSLYLEFVSIDEKRRRNDLYRV